MTLLFPTVHSITVHEILVGVLSMQFDLSVSKLREVLIYAIYLDSLQICKEIMIYDSQTSDKDREADTHWTHEVIMCGLYRGVGLFTPKTHVWDVMIHRRNRSLAALSSSLTSSISLRNGIGKLFKKRTSQKQVGRIKKWKVTSLMKLWEAKYTVL